MKKTLTRITLSIMVVATLLLTTACTKAQTETGDTVKSEVELTPADDIMHAHGLAVDPSDLTRVYIASHDGLFVLKKDAALYRIGTSRDDYMGFSVNPKKPNEIMTSGHPFSGGNLGVQQSKDGGATWEKISNGVNGPVDFHAMAWSPANPKRLYGWYAGSLQRSEDGGESWKPVQANLTEAIALIADPQDENKILAVTLSGVMASMDRGETWNSLSPQLENAFVTALAIDPQNSSHLLSYSKSLGLAESNDGGSTWTSLPEQFKEAFILFLAFDSNQSKTVYALTRLNTLYKSIDDGNTWGKISFKK